MVQTWPETAVESKERPRNFSHHDTHAYPTFPLPSSLNPHHLPTSLHLLPRQIPKNPLKDRLAIIQIDKPQPLIIQMRRIACLAARQMGGGGVEFLLEQADRRDGAALADVEGSPRRLRAVGCWVCAALFGGRRHAAVGEGRGCGCGVG